MKHDKTNPILVVILLLAMSLFASCKKDDDDRSDKKCLISNLHNSWEVVCNGDTDGGSRQISFTYDADDRLSKWEWDDGDYILFEYNSSGQLIKIEELWDGQTEYLHFTWDGNKVTRQPYWDGEPGSSKMIIAFNNDDEIGRVDGYYIYDEEWVLEWYDLYTWQNGNLVKIEEYFRDDWKKSAVIERTKTSHKGILSKNHLHKEKMGPGQKSKSGNSDFVLEYTTTYTHDNKHNPFSLHLVLGLWDVWSPLFQSKNNVVTWTETEFYEGDDYTWTATLTYEYNAQGYPDILTIEADDVDECQWEETITFNYKNCD